MGISTIDAGMLKNAFLAGAKGLEAKKDWINELNVFPVPDGDTGTNMTLTIMAAAREVAELENPTMDQLAKAISSGSLRGARGNSGVILSQLLRGFTKEIKADIVVLDMPLLDTRTRKENLTGTFIADLVLQILSYVAETERQSIKQRQREGIEAAKKRGVKFGRPCIPIPEEFYDLKEKWLNKKITSREAATTINVSQDTFLRWVHLK